MKSEQKKFHQIWWSPPLNEILCNLFAPQTWASTYGLYPFWHPVGLCSWETKVFSSHNLFNYLRVNSDFLQKGDIFPLFSCSGNKTSSVMKKFYFLLNNILMCFWFFSPIFIPYFYQLLWVYYKKREALLKKCLFYKFEMIIDKKQRKILNHDIWLKNLNQKNYHWENEVKLLTKLTFWWTTNLVVDYSYEKFRVGKLE